ncbi:hypothetical protein [Yoonia sp.]|uniref:hypothetical protein n=1 Tax=Yoonia sp. TaxID=2212373 RepID=UPI002FDAFA09
MNKQDFEDETLMAYADGELDAGTAQAVAAAAAADPALARRIEMFATTGSLLGELGRSRPLEPVSSDLEARVRAMLGAESATATVVPFRSPASAPVAWRPAAIAAGLALAVGLAGGYFASQQSGGQGATGLSIASLGAPAIARTLDEVPSGERVAIEGGEIATIASFRNADGEFCREFEFDRADSNTVVSVACRTEAGWEARFAVVATSPDETGYAPASSLQTLDAYLGGVGAGAPLSLEDEAAALSGLRR